MRILVYASAVALLAGSFATVAQADNPRHGNSRVVHASSGGRVNSRPVTVHNSSNRVVHVSPVGHSNGRPGTVRVSGSVRVSAGYRTFHRNGRSFNVRYYPRHYRGWARYCWFPRYRCYGYLSPDDNVWYMWSAQNDAFMPVDYATTFPPTPIDVGGTTVPVPVPGPGGPDMSQLPPGAVPVPPGATPFLPNPGQ